MSVLVETTIGDLVFDLYTDERPRSTLNFLKLCKIKYYNYCVFHSVRRNFIAQCGDPTGTGRGGESIYSSLYGTQAKYFDLETKPRIKHKTKGTISFVNNGNDKHGSQFFITMGEGLDFLDGKHTIFGMLAEGFDTLELLNETICDDNHKPYQDIRITHTVILYDPYDDPKGLLIPERSPEPTKEQLESCRIGADEDIDDERKKSKDEVRKAIEDKELQIGTKILETVGDIHDTDEKPPENVLFVCKLNPVTNAEDLKIIFSRFGKIRSCEIIKDEKTGDSLCYGFVEFKEVEACEKAYFKMDNVLIDDRRIHVDFCQSVGKNKGRKWQKGNPAKVPAPGKEKPVSEKIELKSNKAKKDKDKYSMVFNDEPVAVTTKPKKKESRDRERGNVKEKKKKNESESEEEKKTSAPKSSDTKESRKRKNSPSESEDDPPPREVETKRSAEKRSSEKSSLTPKEKGDVKRKSRKEKYSESESESEDEKVKKEKKKKKANERKVDAKSDESRERKKVTKKKKESRVSDSDEEVEKLSVKPKKKKKTEEYYSDSDELDSRTHTTKKSRKDKYVSEKKKRRVSDSGESETKTYRDNKQKNNNTKKTTKSNKLKSRHIDDSDTEDYGDNDKEKASSSSSRRKRAPVSSHDDDSSEEDGRRSSKGSKASHSVRANSSDDDRRKKSHKKQQQTKKKSRKRDESSYSESSD